MEVKEVKEVVLEIKTTMTSILSGMVGKGLDDAFVAINNVASITNEAQKLRDGKKDIVQRFIGNLAAYFDKLLGDEVDDDLAFDYQSLSLLGEEDLEGIIAMEGMIAHARNCDMQEYLGFNTRLDTIFTSFRIDESNNPLDPEQIGEAFREAMRPVGLNPTALLMTYRQFNSSVFHELESALADANQILINKGILPELNIAARSKKAIKNKRGKPREKTDPDERAFGGDGKDQAGAKKESAQVFSFMQNLMRNMAVGNAGAQVSGAPVAEGAAVLPQGGGMLDQAGATAGGAVVPQSTLPVVGYDLSGVEGGEFALQPGMMVGNQKVALVEERQLTDLLSELQSKIGLNKPSGGGETMSAPIDLNATLGALLEEHNSGDTLNAIDGVSSDVINLITLLFEAIWQDDTIQIPIKELIGRTQITALKIALDDPSFFDNDEHPGRILINELATAGISWTDFDKLEQDPMYKKMLDVVESLLDNYDGDIEFVVSLVAELKDFKGQLSQEGQKKEARLKDATARKARLVEIKQYARDKIRERILDAELHPFVQAMLEKPFHAFLVKLILKEGPGGVSWKPVMNTIDVLLWTVQPGKKAIERARYDKLKPRLIQNLKKALVVAGMDTAKADDILKKLSILQRKSFMSPEVELAAKTAGKTEATKQVEKEAPAAPAAPAAPEEAPEKAPAKQAKVTAKAEAAKESKVAKEQPVAPDTAAVTETELTLESNEKEEKELAPEPKVAPEIAETPKPAEEKPGEVEIEAEEKLEASKPTEATSSKVEIDIEEELEASAVSSEAFADDNVEEIDLDEEMDILALLEAEAKKEELPDSDPHLQQINNIPIGIWMEFQVDGEQSIRGTLAAKISTIDKYVFVNGDGVKVVEKSRMSLAKELKAGTAQIISEAPVIDRAMETVIGKLRDGAPGGDGQQGQAGSEASQEEGGLSLTPK